MDNLSFLLGLNANNGGGGSTPSWSDVTDKPFSSVDTTTGLTITSGVLSADQTILATQSDIPDVSEFITASALTPYVESSSLATVATTGDYDDLLNKPTIPSATQVTVTQGLTTGVTVGSIDVDGVTTTLYAPQDTGSVVGITNTLSSGTAIGDLSIDGITTTLYAPSSAAGVTPNWNATSGQDGYIENKPPITYGGYSNVAVGTSNSVATNSNAFGYNNNLSGAGQAFAFGHDNSASSAGYAIGLENNINNPNAFLFGIGLKTGGAATQARGKWNIINSSFLDTLGNGSNNNSRSNAEATDSSGNKYLAGDVYTHVTNWGTTPYIDAKRLATEDSVYTAINNANNKAIVFPMEYKEYDGTHYLNVLEQYEGYADNWYQYLQDRLGDNIVTIRLEGGIKLFLYISEYESTMRFYSIDGNGYEMALSDDGSWEFDGNSGDASSNNLNWMNPYEEPEEPEEEPEP